MFCLRSQRVTRNAPGSVKNFGAWMLGVLNAPEIKTKQPPLKKKPKTNKNPQQNNNNSNNKQQKNPTKPKNQEKEKNLSLAWEWALKSACHVNEMREPQRKKPQQHAAIFG